MSVGYKRTLLVKKEAAKIHKIPTTCIFFLIFYAFYQASGYNKKSPAFARRGIFIEVIICYSLGSVITQRMLRPSERLPGISSMELQAAPNSQA